MAANESNRRPKPVDGIDLRRLPLTPQQAFVLSRVDGQVDETELVLLTGLSQQVVAAALDHLAALGALTFEQALPRPAHRPQRVAAPSGMWRFGPIVETRAQPQREDSQAAAALYDPSELDEPVELDLQRKRRILDTYYALEGLTHYELLGIPPDADKKAVKAAYYELVNTFHPDRYFGKTLGTFKTKLERVFARLTEAHDVLTRSQARTEYDQYLASQERTRALASTLNDPQHSAREVERIQREIAEQARAVERSHHQYPAPASSRTGAVSATSAPPPRSSLPPSVTPSHRPPVDSDARRRALARKLGVSVPPPAPGRVVADASAPMSSREAAVDELKRRYEQRVVELKRRQVERYIHAADAALAAKDLVSASNALKIAASLVPEDPTLAARFEEVQAQASSTLALSYLEQAQYEEREGRFIEAARSYERVARGKPSARIFDRIAYCLLTGKGDLKSAAEWAKRAVSAAPDEAAFRVTLARIYLDGGLKQSAVAEFERAATLAPKDDTIKDWLKRAKREA